MTFPNLTTPSPTVTSLQAYSRILGSIRAEQSEPHPRWWHASLSIEDDGLATGPFPLGTEGRGSLILDPIGKAISAQGSSGPFRVGLTGTASQVGRSVLVELGGDIQIDPTRWDAIEATSIDTKESSDYLDALISVRDAFASLRSELPGERGPIQLWPHHFDVSVEWFSNAVEVYEEDDGPKEFNKQIGFGFSPGDEGNPEPYFYANPWPFDESFRDIELPAGASWHSEGWSGGYLPYSAVAAAPALLIDFMQTVFNDTHDALS